MRRPLIAPLLVLGLVGAAAAPAAAFEGKPRRAFVIELSGTAVPGGGDPRADGIARIRLDPKRETACLRVAWKDVSGSVTAMHIHAGEAGKTGEHHIELLNDETLAGQKNVFATCVQVQGHGGHSPRELIKAVLEDPEDYYLNVHSTKYPTKGALRGQLADGG